MSGRWVFGKTVIERVLEFDGPGLDPFVLLPWLSPDMLEEHRHWLEPNLLDPASCHSYPTPEIGSISH